MLHIIGDIEIDESEIQFEFTHASGPGGQNINKVATAVRLRFDVVNSPSLPDEIRERLIRLAGRRMTDKGVLIIEARRFRTRERNRQDAMGRILELIRKATEKPKPRRKTRPTIASKMRRLQTKRRHSRTKRMRGPVQPANE